MIGDAKLLDARKIDDFQVVMLGVDCASFDVILGIFTDSAKKEFVRRRAGRRLHVHRLPLGCAFVLRVQANFRGLESDELRCHQLVRFPANGTIAGGDYDVIESALPAFRSARP